MNDIEKAIDYLSLAITKKEKILEKEPEGTALEEFLVRNISALAIAVQALQEKAERDKMRCENCKYFHCHSAVDRIFNCLHMQGLRQINVVEDTPFCSYFEPKESEEK